MLGVSALGILFLALVLGGVVAKYGADRVRFRVLALVPGQLRSVVVAEGADVFQVADRLAALAITERAAFLALRTDQELLREFAVAGSSVEGHLAPATYEFLRETPAREVLRRMLRRRRSDLEVLKGSALPLPLRNWAEVLTLASVVEKESHRSDEQGRIARVFLNRLIKVGAETRGRLQSDPTALYGCLASEFRYSGCGGAATRQVTPEMLRATDNPYNTYRHAGLPPGPIGNPSLGALRAVLDAPPGTELYFVAGKDGRHRFSATYSEHLKFVRQTSEQEAAPDLP
jgi:UPF0755 protein